jgi:hypothetical protein
MKKRLLCLLLGLSCIRLQAVEPVTMSIVVSVGLWAVDKVWGWATYDPVFIENARLAQEREKFMQGQEKVEAVRVQELLGRRREYLLCKIKADSLGNSEFVGNTKIPLACKQLAAFYAEMGDVDTQERIFQEKI